MLSPETLKSKIPMGGRGGWCPTFDAESRYPKISNSYFQGGGVGDQLLMLSPEILKSQIPIGEGRLVTNFQKTTSKLPSQVLS